MNGIVYKYLPPERTGFFENISEGLIQGFFPSLQLVAVSPSLLNDPFECSNIVTVDKRLYLKKLFKSSKSQKEMYTLLKEQGQSISKNEFKSRSKKAYDIAMKDKNWLSKNLPEIKKEFENDYNDLVRIMSLSKTKSSLLMWSHYTKEHKGFVVGIDRKYKITANDRSSKIVWETIDVTYLDNMPLLRLEQPLENIFASTPFRVKSTCWSYEEEVRNIALFEKKLPNDCGISVCTLPSKLINEIILGTRMDKFQKDKIIEECKKNKNLHHVKMFQAELSKTHFKLEFIPIDFLSH